MTIKRRAFIGAASLGAVSATISPAHSHASAEHEGEYERVRPNLVVGVGRGEAVGLSLLWLPSQGREQAPPVKARLIIFDLGGKPLVEEEVVIPAFSGASVNYELPKGAKRIQVFGYAFIEGYEGELIQEVFAGIEIYDTSSGRANIAGAPVGVA